MPRLPFALLNPAMQCQVGWPTTSGCHRPGVCCPLLTTCGMAASPAELGVWPAQAGRLSSFTWSLGSPCQTASFLDPRKVCEKNEKDTPPLTLVSLQKRNQEHSAIVSKALYSVLFRPVGCVHSGKGRKTEKPEVTQSADSDEDLYFWERAGRVWKTDI